MIFYFSATGNTQKLASAIAERTQDTAINIEDAVKQMLLIISSKMMNGSGSVFQFTLEVCRTSCWSSSVSLK
jgi:flavodoxin